MKKSIKVLLMAVVVGAASLATAGTNKAEARIFPTKVLSDCINGQQYQYSSGWFGGGMTETTWDC